MTYYTQSLSPETNISKSNKTNKGCEQMRKKILIYISLAIISIMAIGCQQGGQQVEPQNLKFYYSDGTPALTAAKLAKEKPQIHEQITIDYEMQKTPDLLAASILKEEADIAIVPSNLAAQAFNKDLPYQVVGTSTWGTMYLTTTDEMASFEDLKGKEIYTFGKGLTPDLVLRYVLLENGIVPDEDVTITYVSSAAEIGPAFLSGKTSLAVLPEPLLSVVQAKNEGAKILFDLNEEWGKAAGVAKGFPQSSLIIKTEILNTNPAFAQSFIAAYEEGRKWATENPDILGDYAEALELNIEPGIIKKGIRWTNPDDFKIDDSLLEYQAYYEAIIDFAPEFIGGKVPSEKLYFRK